jgi:deazaflavin-dependent oxidoreductase (nitroreductase family)
MALTHSQTFIKTVSVIHRCLYSATNGRIGGKLGRVPTLLLTTKGRKSGRSRTTPLLYIKDDSNYVVVASNGGDDRHPSWWLNLRDSPKARVQVRKRKFEAVAKKAGPEEKARLWPELTKVYPGYDAYQTRTKREIPVVILRPEAAAAKTP